MAPEHQKQRADLQLLNQLKSLQEASKELQSNPFFPASKLQSTELFSHLESIGNAADPDLLKLSDLLIRLKTLLERLEKCQGYSLSSIVGRQIANYKIYRVASVIDTEIQAFFDRESVEILVTTLQESEDEDEKINVLIEFEERLSRGFDLGFQELVLKAKVFSILELLLCNASCSIKVQDEAAVGIAALVKFNKDVFVGLVLMGPTIRALITMSTCRSIEVLSWLIKWIRIPLVDELETQREIPRIVGLLDSETSPIRAASMDCLLWMVYYGRKEAIESMLEAGLIGKLVELQRLENGENLGGGGEDSTSCAPFVSGVAKFAVQVELGELLSKKEKKEFKIEILRRVREASVSEAECASIVADVLWGCSS